MDIEAFEAFMFSERGCELHSKINTSDISANAFAWEIWQAAIAHKQAETDTLKAKLSKLQDLYEEWQAHLAAEYSDPNL
jgi:hypothetical protein